MAVSISDPALDGELSLDRFGESDRGVRDRSFLEHDGCSNWLHRFVLALRDSFEHFGFDSPVYPFSEH